MNDPPPAPPPAVEPAEADPLAQVVNDYEPRLEALEWAVEELYADRSFESVAGALVGGGWSAESAEEIVEAARRQTRDYRGVLTRDEVVGRADRRYRQAMTGRWYVGMPMLAAAWRLMHSLSTLFALRRAKAVQRQPRNDGLSE